MLRGQKRALELAMANAPLHDVLAELVRAIEEHCDENMIASIQIVDGGRLRHGAAPNLPDEYNAIVDGHPIGENEASCGTAAYLDEIVVVADIANDVRWARYKHVAARFGLAASWSMPIHSPEGKIVGTFAHYYREPRDPTPRDREAVEWITHTAGLVLAREMDARKQREGEQALRAARADLERQVESMHLVHELAVGLYAASDLEPVLDLVLDIALRLHDAQHGALFVYANDQLEIATSRGFERVPRELLAKLTSDVRQRDGQRYVVEDTEADPRYAHLLEVSRTIGSRAVHRTPIRTRGGKSLGVLVVHLLTPRAPTELEQQMTDLCARYAADALEWARTFDELRTAKESAERANRAKDEFLAILGHELRNPLAPIANAVQLLDMRSADESTRATRDVIQRQLGHLTRLVDDLLDISRIREGRLELHRTQLDVGDLIARAIEMTHSMFATRGHKVHVIAEPDLRIEGDATRLTQVISNLLVNAAKYSDPNKTVTVNAMTVGDTIEIAVRDQGVGIAREMLPHVFELFTQEERSLERAHGGLGLGLAIVRKLVTLHGGSVRAQSPGVGKGSTFTIVLPALANVRIREATTRTSALRSSRARRVLVVDDNTDVADMMSELLAEMGHTVRTANDGTQALELISQFDAEVALLDLGLPGMDGFELARTLRDKQVPSPFLVAVSGYGRASDRERAKQAGFDAHLVKPVSVDSVVRVIDSAPARG